MNTADIRQPSVESRLSLLERRLRVYHAIAIICCAFAIVTVASGAFQSPVVYRATAYEVVDSNGVLRAAFGLDDRGQPALFFFGLAGAPPGTTGTAKIVGVGTDGKTISVYGSTQPLKIEYTPAK
jgi:hypothetical protein